MKIAIMTWYKFNNYGSKLQATALAELIKKQNHEPYFINYKPRGIIYEKNNLSSFYDKLHKKIKAYTINKAVHNEQFEIFSKNNFKETKECDSYIDLYQLNDSFDAFICGSDQIWSPNNFDPRFYLDYVMKDKKIAYAPSIGFNKIDSQIVKIQMKELICDFKYLSIREKTGAEIINKMCGIDAKVVLDPTLVLNEMDWFKYENKNLNKKLKKERYILTYFLGDCKHISNIEKFAKKNNYKIYNIPVYKYRKINKYSYNYEIGPDTFLSLIKNASFIFTDSFHGMAFSINYNKNFYVYKRFNSNSKINQNSRIIDLLDKLGINDRLIDSNNCIDNDEINYKDVNKILESLRESSLSFLNKSLIQIMSKIKNGDKKNNCELTPFCTGCSSCFAVCPVNAITIEKNKEGFFAYKKNEKKCINCGACQKACPMMKLESISINDCKKLYSFKSLDNKVLDKSSSGGFAYTVSNMLNQEGYYVCGCTYDNKDDMAKHIIINPYCNKDLSKIQGSKYIQSNTSLIIKECVNIGKNNNILFIGTPCQVAALDKITRMKRIRDNFILIDLICHGVPSYYLWEKYLKEKKKKYVLLNKNHNIIIRDSYLTKRNRYYKLVIKDSNGNTIYSKNQNKDYFYILFNEGTCFNKSCFECPYRTKSSADIRIGDYWSEKFSKDTKSTSMIIPITKTGIHIINKINNMKVATINEEIIEDYFKIQYPYNKLIPLQRDQLIKDLKNNKKRLNNICKEYYKYQRIINKIYKIKNKLKK